MRLLIDIEHPAHVHFFKNFAWQMSERGHEILISAFDKEVTLDLLRVYNFEYDLCGKQGNSLFASAKQLLGRDWRVYNLTCKFKPDIIVGIGDIVGAQVSSITKAKSIVFADTEHATLNNMLCFPFANVICTPTCFNKDLGRKQVRYNGYHELAYLHPNYFKPDPTVLDDCRLKKDDKYVIVRFVAWQATHDIGQHGLSLSAKRRLIAEIELQGGRTLITSEVILPEEFERYRIKVRPDKMHDLLYYATLYIGEGATMASECAVLGTPAIYINTLKLGYLDEQEEKYGLIFNFGEAELAIRKSVELLAERDIRQRWAVKRQRMMADKIDVTNFMIDFFENYLERLRGNGNVRAKPM